MSCTNFYNQALHKSQVLSSGAFHSLPLDCVLDSRTWGLNITETAWTCLEGTFGLSPAHIAIAIATCCLNPSPSLQVASTCPSLHHFPPRLTDWSKESKSTRCRSTCSLAFRRPSTASCAKQQVVGDAFLFFWNVKWSPKHRGKVLFIFFPKHLDLGMLRCVSYLFGVYGGVIF